MTLVTSIEIQLKSRELNTVSDVYIATFVFLFEFTRQRSTCHICSIFSILENQRFRFNSNCVILVNDNLLEH